MSEVAFLRKGQKTKKKEKPKTISKKEFIPFDRRAKRNEKPQEENPTFAKVSYTNSLIISARIKIKVFCVFLAFCIQCKVNSESAKNIWLP